MEDSRQNECCPKRHAQQGAQRRHGDVENGDHAADGEQIGTRAPSDRGALHPPACRMPTVARGRRREPPTGLEARASPRYAQPASSTTSRSTPRQPSTTRRLAGCKVFQSTLASSGRADITATASASESPEHMPRASRAGDTRLVELLGSGVSHGHGGTALTTSRATRSGSELGEASRFRACTSVLRRRCAFPRASRATPRAT